uniref:4-hydroxy-2-oxoglutarate aldolase, mitochondrial n=1 Tax=Cacopsylla melanoneura TaxID=428564 RepID=A0A8D8VTH1_9HEMI
MLAPLTRLSSLASKPLTLQCTASRISLTLQSMMSTSSGQPDLYLKGVYSAIPTTFGPDEEIDFEKFTFNVSKWEKVPLKGYAIGGTNGEQPFLTEEEKLKIIRTLRQLTKKTIIAGTYCESTRATIDLTQKAAQAGANAALILCPYYFQKKMTEDLIYEHFISVADNSPIPVIIYNNTFVTGIDISVNTLVKLAHHENIRGVKDTENIKLANLSNQTKDLNFSVFAGSAGYLLSGLLVGCAGGINALSAVLGDPICEVYDLAKKGKWDEAMKLQHRLVKPDVTLMKEMGVPGTRAAMELYGYYGIDIGINRYRRNRITTISFDSYKDHMVPDYKGL